MPRPSSLISAVVLICERVLMEADSVASAIRIVDLFNVPDLPPGAPADSVQMIQAWGYANLKFDNTATGEHKVQFILINTKGELSNFGEEPGIVSFPAQPPVPEAPMGVNLVIQINLRVKNFGTGYLCVYLDGEEVARTQFTIRRQPPADVPVGSPQQSR